MFNNGSPDFWVCFNDELSIIEGNRRAATRNVDITQDENRKTLAFMTNYGDDVLDRSERKNFINFNRAPENGER